jgi:hypothetical protein
VIVAEPATPTRTPAPEIEHRYRTLLAERQAALATCERQHVWLSRLRLVLVAIAIAIPLAGGLEWAAWSFVPVILFGLVAAFHGRRLDDRRSARSAVAFYERGLARLAHAWIGRGEQGDAFRQPDHLYADDLDIFGRGSLFELLATTRTRAGQATLAKWLLEPAGPEEIRARQDAVRELATRIDLREAMAVLGDDPAVGVHADGLRAWATAPMRLRGAGLRLLPAALAAVLVTLVAVIAATGTLTLLELRMLAVLVLVEGATALWLRPRVIAVIGGLDEPTRDLELLSAVLRKLERERFESPRLATIQRALGGPHTASKEIRRLGLLATLLASRRNLFFALPAALLLWATQFAFAIERWRDRAGRHVPEWLDAVGEFEALAALGTFAYEHPDYTYPDVHESHTGLTGDEVAHPLLDADAVPNDTRLGGAAPALYIVSGSNMSGKSTWLRAIGINVVLAAAGAPVRAARLEMAPLSVGAAMRAEDSLVDGRSRFMAEITRLKQIADRARAHPGRVLFLLDEVLGGTNSHDRRQGAEGLLGGLTALGAIGLVTTHDLSLGALAEHLTARVENVHFEDSFDGVHLSFDYRLRPGIVRTSNAIALMKSIGLDV